MMFRQNLPLLGLLVLLFALCQNCSSSSCGNLLKISCPFRLKGAPHQCGCGAESAGGLELDCENNRASFLLDSVKFYVQEIDYVYQTIRIMDASLHQNTCSIPRLIQNINDSYSRFRTSTYTFNSYEFSIGPGYSLASYYMYFLNCTKPINSPLYVDVSHCIGNSYSAQTRFFYAYFGYLSVFDLPDLCRIEGSAPSQFPNATGLSALEIQQKLLLQDYGIGWSYYCVYSQNNKKLKYKW